VLIAKDQFAVVQAVAPSFQTTLAHTSVTASIRFYGPLILSRAQDGQLMVWVPSPTLANSAIDIVHRFFYEETFHAYYKFDIATQRRLLVV
jgi:hypothetical protein